MSLPAQKQLTPRGLGLLLALALIWGGSFVSNRAALAELSVLWVVTFRVGGAAALLWAYCRARGVQIPFKPMQFLIMGVLSCALPFSLIVWGQTHIDSGMAAILNATTALFGVVAAALVFDDERMTRAKALGAVLGFGGVVLCVWPELAGAEKSPLRLWGQIAILGSSLAYTAANIYARPRVKGMAPEVAATGMLTAATVMMVPLALAFEGVPSLSHSASVWAGLAWLIVISTALSYILYYRVLEEVGAGNFGLVTLMIPPFAILFGAALYGERLSLFSLAGFGVLALGLLISGGWLKRRA